MSADEAKDKAEAANETKNAAMENKGHACNFFDQVMGIVAAPVAGGCLSKVLYYFLVLSTLGFFLSCLVNVIPTFSKPISEVSSRFNQTLQYPDSYFCVPAFQMQQVKSCSACAYGIIGLSKYKSTASDKKCLGWSQTNGIQGNMDKAFQQCSVSTVGVSDLKIANTWYINSDGSSFANFDSSMSQVDEKKTPFVSDQATVDLAEAMPTYTDPEDSAKTVHKAFCFSMRAGPEAIAKYDEGFNLLQFNGMQTSDSSLTDTFFFQAYFVQQGRLPTKKIGDKTAITASFTLWPAKGSVTQATFSVESITDTTSSNAKDPNSVFNETRTLVYHPVVGAQPMRMTYYKKAGATDAMSYNTPYILNVNMVRFGSFVIRDVLIRDKTYAEIWAEIGGLWAGCCAILLMFFTQSGHVQKNDEKGNPGRELMIFRHMPKSSKKKALEPFVKKATESEEEAGTGV
jgi:hypothetical protein